MGIIKVMEMDFKICPICKKKFFKSSMFKDNISWWKKKIYCSEECLKKAVKQRNKKEYVLKNTFHDNIVIELNKLIKGEIIYKQNGDGENPDIKTEETNYELEIYSNFHKWKKKYKRARENKKHILIIHVDDRLKEYFDEILFFSSDNKITK